MQLGYGKINIFLFLSLSLSLRGDCTFARRDHFSIVQHGAINNLSIWVEPIVSSLLLSIVNEAPPKEVFRDKFDIP